MSSNAGHAGDVRSFGTGAPSVDAVDAGTVIPPAHSTAADGSNGAATVTTALALAVEGVSKSYGGVHAVADVGFTLRHGEVLALAGHNGAGKSTLIGILGGVRHPDSGTVVVNGQQVSLASARDAQEAGIGVVYQEPILVPQLTVEANVFLSRERRTSTLRIDRRDLSRRFEALVAQTGIELPGKALVADLSVAQQQMAQILRAVAGGARIVILDEPTAALSPTDRARLFELIERMRSAERPTSFILVSHFLDELEMSCDRAVVMRSGRVVSTIDRPPLAKELAEIMAGPAGPPAAASTEPVVVGDVLLGVDALRVGDAPPATLSVRAGEIVGLAGLVGSGRTELLRAIAFNHGATSAEVAVTGLQPPTRKGALRPGLALLPENRRDALIGDWSLWKNVSLPSLRQATRLGRLDRRAERVRAEGFLDRCRVVANSSDQKVKELSGGNQQKVAFAKLLSGGFSVGLLDEPTHGVDVHAKAEIFSIISDLARDGQGFLVAAAEFEDLLAVCTRVITLHKGQLVAEHVVAGEKPIDVQHLLYEAATGRHFENLEAEGSVE